MAGIEKINYFEALDILFAGIEIDGGRVAGTSIDPPPGWPVWTKPTKAKPISTIEDIDDLIERLVMPKKVNATTILRETGNKLDERCPYYSVRRSIARAVEVARIEAFADAPIADRVKEIDILIKKSNKLYIKLKEFSNDYQLGYNNKIVKLIYPLENAQNSKHRFSDKSNRRSDLLMNFETVEKAVLALRAFVVQAEKAREAIGIRRAPGDLHRRFFTRYLAQWWLNWTGKKAAGASKDAAFWKFLNAAYVSLGLGPQSSWESSISTALADLDDQPKGVLTTFDRDTKREEARKRFERAGRFKFNQEGEPGASPGLEPSPAPSLNPLLQDETTAFLGKALQGLVERIGFEEEINSKITHDSNKPPKT